MPSGKQILLSLLSEYSQRETVSENLSNVSDRIRAGLLLHCSTAEETWFKVDKIAWLSEDDNGVSRQGLGFEKQRVFFTDLIDELSVDERLFTIVKEKFPELTKSDIDDAMFFIWHILSSIQFFTELSSVENDGELDPSEKEFLLENYQSKWKLFKDDPYDYLGINKEC